MSKARWGRFFGLPRNRWAGRDQARRPLPEDCETVVTPTVLKQAGVTNPARGLRALLDDPRFHHYLVRLPDGHMVKATHQTSLNWIVGVQRDENRERSRANLMAGSQAPILETLVEQGSGAPFVAEIWRVPVAPPTLRTDAPLPEARRRSSLERPGRQADRAVAVARSDRELYSELEDHLCGEVLRIIAAAEAPIGLADIAAELQLPLLGEEGRALRTALHRLKDEGAIIDKPGGGERLYHVAPPRNRCCQAGE